MARWRRKGTERQLREMQESLEGGPLRERTQVSGAGWGQDEKLQEEKEGRRRENLEAEARQAGPGEGEARDRELRKKDAPPHVVPTQRRAPTAGRLEQQQRHADPWACCLLSDGEGLLPRGHQS